MYKNISSLSLSLSLFTGIIIAEEQQDVNTTPKSKSEKYVSQTFRQTNWINSAFLDEEVAAAISFDNKLHSITEFGFSSNKEWGVNLGIVLTDPEADTDSQLEQIFGDIHGRNLSIKFELAEITGSFTPQNNIIMPPGIDRFNNDYRYIGVGYDLYEKFKSPVVFGMAFVQYETPTINNISYADIDLGIPELFLDPSTTYTGLGVWFNIDNFRSSVRNYRPMMAKKISEGKAGETYFGLDLEIIMGFSQRELSDESITYMEQLVGAPIQVEDPLMYYYGATFRLQIYHVMKFDGGNFGATGGLEFRGHQSMDFSGFQPGNNNVYITSGDQVFFWGPYLGVAGYW